ncbi:thioredoxin family protein, partial [Treponema endosymbiont of Eucomonympha sp.]
MKVGKINVDEEPSLAERFDVQSIPTVMLFKGGQEVKRSVGS